MFSPHKNAEIEISHVIKFPIAVFGHDRSAKREEFVKHVKHNHIGQSYIPGSGNSCN